MAALALQYRLLELALPHHWDLAREEILPQASLSLDLIDSDPPPPSKLLLFSAHGTLHTLFSR